MILVGPKTQFLLSHCGCKRVAFWPRQFCPKSQVKTQICLSFLTDFSCKNTWYVNAIAVTAYNIKYYLVTCTSSFHVRCRPREIACLSSVPCPIKLKSATSLEASQTTFTKFLAPRLHLAQMWPLIGLRYSYRFSCLQAIQQPQQCHTQMWNRHGQIGLILIIILEVDLNI